MKKDMAEALTTKTSKSFKKGETTATTSECSAVVLTSRE